MILHFFILSCLSNFAILFLNLDFPNKSLGEEVTTMKPVHKVDHTSEEHDPSGIFSVSLRFTATILRTNFFILY